MWISIDTLRPFGDLLVAWMLTYALHSSLLVLMAGLTTWWLRRRNLAVQETAWKLALLGGLVTASLQIGLGITPLTGSWAVGWESPATEPAAPPVEISSTELSSPAPRPLVEPRVAATPVDVPPTVAPATAPTATAPARPVAWGVAVSGTWLGVGLLLCLLLGLSYLRLAYRLRDRTEISSGRLPGMLAKLLGGISRPIRMTTTHRLPIPIAKGVIRREICLPRRALSDLSPEQQETLLAHEAAHLLHRDPFWLAIARFVESLFFFQPLNRLARRRMQEISEFRCDDWTVERTGRPLTLARCLTEVAGWNVGVATPVPAPGMAQDTSGLGSRVRRLLDRDYPQPQEKQPRWLRPVLAAALLVVVVSAPGVSLAGGEEEPPPEAPPAPESPVAAPDEAPAPPAPPEPVTPVVAATPTAVAILAPTPVVAPAPAAAPAPVVAPRLALAAAPATPVSLSTAILAAQEKIDKDTGESDEEAREEEIEGHLEALEDRLGSHHIELERLAHEAARGARTEGLSDEEISQLRAEAQRIAAEARPSAAEMAEMKAQLRKAGEEAKRAVAQADLDRAEVEAALETWRADYQVELEKLRAELESLRKKYD